ncbi:hypothetical protein VNO77_22593 [Canavalia gladiata]|uniref:Uncharacterized protein n=1 Tax=Canavalia gladiata TaxID=3824 RepID=A0AAN9L3C6_CANGL
MYHSNSPKSRPKGIDQILISHSPRIVNDWDSIIRCISNPSFEFKNTNSTLKSKQKVCELILRLLDEEDLFRSLRGFSEGGRFLLSFFLEATGITGSGEQFSQLETPIQESRRRKRRPNEFWLKEEESLIFTSSISRFIFLHIVRYDSVGRRISSIVDHRLHVFIAGDLLSMHALEGYRAYRRRHVQKIEADVGFAGSCCDFIHTGAPFIITTSGINDNADLGPPSLVLAYNACSKSEDALKTPMRPFCSNQDEKANTKRAQKVQRTSHEAEKIFWSYKEKSARPISLHMPRLRSLYSYTLRRSKHPDQDFISDLL